MVQICKPVTHETTGENEPWVWSQPQSKGKLWKDGRLAQRVKAPDAKRGCLSRTHCPATSACTAWHFLTWLHTSTHKIRERLSAIVKQHFYPRELNVSDSTFVLSFLIILGGISPWVENTACSAGPFVYVLCPGCPFLESDWGRRRGKTQTGPPLFVTSCDKTETGWRLSCIHGFETPTSSPFFIVMGP